MKMIIAAALLAVPHAVSAGQSWDMGGGTYIHQFDDGTSGTSWNMGGGNYMHNFSNGASGNSWNMGGGTYMHQMQPSYPQYQQPTYQPPSNSWSGGSYPNYGR